MNIQIQGKKLSEAQISEMNTISQLISRVEPEDEMINAWRNFLTYSIKPNIDPEKEVSEMDIDTLIQSVLHESYMYSNKELEYQVGQVEYFNQVKGKIREDISALREEFDKHVKCLEEQAESYDESFNDWQLKLQDSLQKQSQLFNMLSTIMKNFSDTSKAVINNIK
jgi:chaperonin cofactor prefoldin